MLCHCHRGVSRSTAIVIAYMMVTDPKLATFEQALQRVREVRPCAKPNTGFVKQLREWEKHLPRSLKAVEASHAGLSAELGGGGGAAS